MSHFDGERNERRRCGAEHSYDNERNSAKCGMAKEETARIAGGYPGGGGGGRRRGGGG